MNLYFKYFKLHLKSEMQYKVSFILSFISQFFVFFGSYFSIICLFDKFSNIKGFTMYEVLFVFGVVQFGFSFCETFFRGIDQFDDLIISGNFDRLLLRPRSVLFQIFCNEVSFTKLSRFIQSVIILIISIIKVDISWNIEKIITLVFMLIASIFVFLSIFILTASYCFFTVKGLEVRNVLTYGTREMSQYPIGIFSKGFIMFFTVIVPIGFVNYYPLLFILGNKTNKIFIISPLITILYLIPSIIIFYKGLKRYSSVGS